MHRPVDNIRFRTIDRHTLQGVLRNLRPWHNTRTIIFQVLRNAVGWEGYRVPIRSAPLTDLPPIALRTGQTGWLWWVLTVSYTFLSLWKYHLFKNMFNRATHPPRPSFENLAEFAWWKIFYFSKTHQTHLGCRGDFYGAIQVLRNAIWGVSAYPKKSVT